MRRVRHPVLRISAVLPVLLCFSCATRAPEQPVPAPSPEPPSAVLPASAQQAAHENLREHLLRGDAPAALHEYEQGFLETEAGPQERLLYSRLLMLADRLEDSRRELELLEKDVGPVSPPAFLAEVLFQRALLAGLEGNREAAAEFLDRVLAADGSHPLALAARGELFLQERDHPEAERCFERALQTESGLGAALIGLGGVRIHQGRASEALDLLDRAVRAEPDHALAWQERARARTLVEDIAGAIEDLSQALVLEPGHYWSHLDRGRLYLRVHQREAAGRDFDAAIEQDPDNFAAWAYRAGLNYEEDRLEESLRDFEKVLALRPDYFHAYAPLGTLYYIRKDWRQAERMFRAVRRSGDPEPAEVLMAALAIQHQGEPQRARDYLETALAQLPADSWTREVGRYLIDPSLEPRTLDRIAREKNRLVGHRMLFYVASRALMAGRTRQAASYLLEVRDRLPKEYWEQKIALWTMKSSGL